MTRPTNPPAAPGTRIIRVLSSLVPAARRDDWTAEWVGELTHAWDERRAHGDDTATSAWHLRARASGALRDALWLQRHHRAEPAPTVSSAARIDALWSDTRVAFRGFRRRPFFTGMIVVTLALGIGANATMFGILDRILLQAPAHIADPDRVALLRAHQIGSEGGQTTQPYVMRTVMAEQVPDFADVAVATPTAVVRRQYFPVGAGATAGRVAGSLVSANYFSVLGVHPALGRFFLPDEETPTNPNKVIVLGYGYWQRQYSGSRDAIGRAIQIGTSSFTIVGVAPEGFTGTEIRDVDVWLPIVGADGLRFDRQRDWMTNPGSEWLLVIARLKPGVAPQQAAAQATAAYRNWTRATMQRPTPALLAQVDSQVIALGSLIPGKSQWAWGLSGSPNDIGVSKLLGGVALMVLLIACANVANLLLLRAAGRQREIAVRLALGVSRRRLVAQLMGEGILLSLMSTAAALGVTAVASPFIRRWLVGDGAWTGGALNGRVLLFSVVVGLLTGIVTSLAPALQSSRPDLAEAIKAGARSGSVQHSRARDALLVAQAALAIVLLAGAGMFIRSLRNAAALDLGVDVDRVLVAQINQGVINLSTDDARRLFDRFAEQVKAVPGVAESAVTVALPFSMSWGTSIHIPGRELSQPPGQGPVQYAVTAPYFKVLGVRVLAGRAFSDADRAGGAPVAIINETMARVYWSGRSPIGACVKVGSDTMPCSTIVGVVTNTRRQDLVEGLVPQIYRPLDQVPRAAVSSIVSFFGYTLIVRTRGDARTLIEPVRRAMQGVGPSVPYANVQTMHDLLSGQTRTWELGARVFSAFGLLALLLAGVGLFSVVAFTISQRMHELGIRTALGAQRGDLVRLTLVCGVAPAAGGIIAGVGLALLASPLVKSLLFQESPSDPVTLGGAAAVMLICALLASVVPAMRAAGVDPTTSLRTE